MMFKVTVDATISTTSIPHKLKWFVTTVLSLMI